MISLQKIQITSSAIFSRITEEWRDTGFKHKWGFKIPDDEPVAINLLLAKDLIQLVDPVNSNYWFTDKGRQKALELLGF